MAQVTVGVPVYNGADFLEKSLVCLRDQTYRDIEVLIFDNCSEDATGEIAQSFCAADPRFRYFRQPENKGCTPNFLDVLEAANSPYFLWRAADDTSDLNYIETLLALLQRHPERDMAVPKIVGSLPDGRIKWKHPVSPLIERGGATGRVAALFLARPAWIYGLFRREAMCRILPEVLAEYQFLLGWDVVTLMPFSFDRKIIGTNATTFNTYLRFPDQRPTYHRRAAVDDVKLERARSLLAYAHRHVNRVISNPIGRWFYHLVIAYYGHKRGYSFSKRLRVQYFSTLKASAKRGLDATG
jgi:glycosyltransferase involved in cell wall biosynthesis